MITIPKPIEFLGIPIDMSLFLFIIILYLVCDYIYAVLIYVYGDKKALHKAIKKNITKKFNTFCSKFLEK